MVISSGKQPHPGRADHPAAASGTTQRARPGPRQCGRDGPVAKAQGLGVVLGLAAGEDVEDPDGDGVGLGALAAASVIALPRLAWSTVPSFLPFTMTVGVPDTPRLEALSVIAWTSALCSWPVTQ